MPTPEQLQSFVTRFDGETRPDLVPFYLKVRDAISDYYSLERLKEVFTPRDSELTEAFRLEFPVARQAVAKVVDEMWRKLCERLEDLDAESIATEVQKMDIAQIELQDARARVFLDSLTPDAATVVLSEADRVGRAIKGTNNDVVRLARQHPDFVKQRNREICIARGFAPKPPR